MGMPNQQLKPTLKLSHGTDMDTPVTMVTHTLMVVTTDTHTATTILERDLLMPNQKPNHGMVTVDIMVMVIHTDMDMDTGVKPINYYCNEHKILNTTNYQCLLNFKIICCKVSNFGNK